jgi:hypothetical protein
VVKYCYTEATGYFGGRALPLDRRLVSLPNHKNCAAEALGKKGKKEKMSARADLFVWLRKRMIEL